MKHYGHKAVRRVEAHMAKAKYAVLLADPRAVGQVHAVKFQSSQMMLFPSENHFELPFSHEGVVLLNFRAQVGFQQRRAMGRQPRRRRLYRSGFSWLADARPLKSCPIPPLTLEWRPAIEAPLGALATARWTRREAGNVRGRNARR